jgi:hypothetical protein
MRFFFQGERKKHPDLFPEIVLVYTCIIALATTYGAQAKAKSAPVELYQQFIKAQLASQRDSDDLAEKMQVVAWAFKKNRVTTGSFPEQGYATAVLERKLHHVAGTNPYFDFPFRTVANDPQFNAKYNSNQCNSNEIAVLIHVDLGLSSMRLAQFKTAVPDDWIAMPGTITIIHNTENLFLVWGAGVDGRPIKDKATNEYAIIGCEL